MIPEALAQGASVVNSGGESLALYVLSIFNTVLIAGLGFLLRSRENAATTAQRQMYEAMREVAKDLKSLNDAVLGKYATQERLESAVNELHRRIDSSEEARRKSAHDVRDEIHRFELKLATLVQKEET